MAPPFMDSSDDETAENSVWNNAGVEFTAYCAGANKQQYVIVALTAAVVTLMNMYWSTINLRVIYYQKHLHFSQLRFYIFRIY